MKIKLFSIICCSVVTGLVYWWYVRTSVNDEDFHLQYILSDKNEDFYKKRNDDINLETYTYNNEVYVNNHENYNLTLYAIDSIGGEEKILIVADYVYSNKRITNLTYKDKTGQCSPLEIRQKNDSVFIYQLSELPRTNKYLIFEGLRMNATRPN